jgi:MmgE/PrpD N-terminal domain
MASPQMRGTIVARSENPDNLASRPDGTKTTRSNSTKTTRTKGQGRVASEMVSRTAHLATDPEGPTGRLATWLAATDLNDVPTSVREHAKHLMLDGIGCGLVGAQLPVSRIGVEGVTALGDDHRKGTTEQ